MIPKIERSKAFSKLFKNKKTKLVRKVSQKVPYEMNGPRYEWFESHKLIERGWSNYRPSLNGLHASWPAFQPATGNW